MKTISVELSKEDLEELVFALGRQSRASCELQGIDQDKLFETYYTLSLALKQIGDNDKVKINVK